MTSPAKRTSSRLSASKTPTKKSTPERRGSRQGSSMQNVVSPTTEGSLTDFIPSMFLHVVNCPYVW